LVIPEIADRMDDLRAICERYGVSRLELFGSAAREIFDLTAATWTFPSSSLEHGLNRGYANRYVDLLEALKQLFDRSIDLVVGSSIRNPYFREAVEQTKALVYAP
jgi:predicted nucleotidyltransferase